MSEREALAAKLLGANAVAIISNRGGLLASGEVSFEALFLNAGRNIPWFNGSIEPILVCRLLVQAV